MNYFHVVDDFIRTTDVLHSSSMRDIFDDNKEYEFLEVWYILRP